MIINYSKEELGRILGSIGENPKINRTVQFYNPDKIFIGDNVRIDAFCILTGIINIGNYVHLGTNVTILGEIEVDIQDFVGISGKVSIYSATDDYSEGYMSGPQVPLKFRKVKEGKVTLEKHSLIGANSVILPNLTIREGASVGALSLVNKNIPKYTCVSGNPVRKICKRGIKFLEFEKELRSEK